MSNVDLAVEKFLKGSVCSQAILSTFANKTDINPLLAHRIGTGFGAGMGKKQYTCGAITAAVILLSLKYGNEYPGEEKKKEKTYNAVYEFIEKMEQELGNSECYELLGASIKTEDELIFAMNSNIFVDRCAKIVKIVAEELDRVF